MSNKKDIVIVVSSRMSGEQGQDYINKVMNSCNRKHKLFFVTNNNQMSLTKLYGDFLKNKEIDNDIFVFCHDDIEFLKKGWDDELIRMFEEHEDYGIIGVAGSADFDAKAKWWQYPNIYGQVLHRNNGESWLSKFSPLLDKDLEEVCVIDGLFIAVDRTRITKNFDYDVNGFNFYDIDFCLANFLDGKTKIGVTTNIRIVHNSIGELSPNWYTNRDFINNKYKDFYPIHVKRNSK